MCKKLQYRRNKERKYPVHLAIESKQKLEKETAESHAGKYRNNFFDFLGYAQVKQSKEKGTLALDCNLSEVLPACVANFTKRMNPKFYWRFARVINQKVLCFDFSILLFIKTKHLS